MTKAAVARKSFGKNETPNKQKIANAGAKTPNSALKQIKTPKSGAKAQTNVSFIHLSLEKKIFESNLV